MIIDGNSQLRMENFLNILRSLSLISQWMGYWVDTDTTKPSGPTNSKIKYGVKVKGDTCW